MFKHIENNELDQELIRTGWSVVADPNTGIDIYNLLVDNRNFPTKIFSSIIDNCKPLNYVGDLHTLCKNENVSLSPKHKIAYASDSDFGKKEEITVRADISYLKKLFQNIGATLKGVFDFSNVQKVDFTFTNPERHFQTINDISNYIKSGKVIQTHNNYDDLTKNKVYVVYEIKKTKSFITEFFDQSNNNLEFDVQALNNDIKGNIKASHNKNIKSEIYFEGDIPIVIAFKAAKIIHLDEAYSVFESKYNDLDQNIYSNTELRLLYRLIGNVYPTEEEFRNALPDSMDKVKKDLIVRHFKFGNFKLDPTDNLRFLEGEHTIENLNAEVPFVSITN